MHMEKDFIFSTLFTIESAEALLGLLLIGFIQLVLATIIMSVSVFVFGLFGVTLHF